MTQAGPVMEKVLEENLDLYFHDHGNQKAKKRNAVEPQPSIKFLQPLLYLFADADNNPARIMKVTCIHMFESSPQSKLAIAYTLKKYNKEEIYLVLVYSLMAKKFSSILYCE